MLKSSLDIAPDCRECFGVESIIAKLATTQAVYVENYRQFERRSEAQASPAGQEYQQIEGQLLDILELATFCRGRANGNCFAEEISTLDSSR